MVSSSELVWPRAHISASVMNSSNRWEVITYDIFRTFDLSFMLGGWYKQEEQGIRPAKYTVDLG
jgi:hypothetical protein